MITIQRFLVPLDFSEMSIRALDYAITLGAHLQAHLTLLHVIQALPEPGQDMGPSPLLRDHLAMLEAEIIRDMETYLKRVQAAGLKGDSIVAHGVPYLATIETAKTHQIDLIIMGSHGRTGLSHLLLGSIAERVLRLAPCPVLIVR